MKTFPAIAHWSPDLFGQHVIMFDKLDGSNFRAEWSKKRGFYKFGTRRQLITENHPHFGEAVDIFMEKYSEDLEKVFKKHKDYSNTRIFTVFAEYLGPNSFAGQHVESDKKDVVIIDVCQYKRGILPPKEFVKNFGHLDIPKIVYRGELNNEIISDIKDNVYQLSEGVVIKGSGKRKGKHYAWMAKCKSKEWLDKLRNDFGEEALMEDINGDTSIL